jgi:hypothetical protein
MATDDSFLSPLSGAFHLEHFVTQETTYLCGLVVEIYIYVLCARAS